jgi:hypothetical protein
VNRLLEDERVRSTWTQWTNWHFLRCLKTFMSVPVIVTFILVYL